MNVKLLTEHHLEFLSRKGGCRGSSESTLVKMPHCWKSHALAQLLIIYAIPALPLTNGSWVMSKYYCSFQDRHSSTLRDNNSLFGKSVKDYGTDNISKIGKIF